MNTDLIVPFAVDLLLKSSVVLIFAWLALQIWRRASAAQRGCIWCVTFALLAVLPFTRLVAPHWALSFSKASAPVEPAPTMGQSDSKVIVPDEIVSASPVRTLAMPDGATLGAGIWLAGIFLLVAYRLTGAFLLQHCRRSSSILPDNAGGNMAASIGAALGITRPVDVRVSRTCQVPVTWGTWRPVVMLPAEALDWPQEWLESALRHEMGHVRNYDHLKRLAAFLICAFYWPNPLVWVAAKQLQLAQEEASDNLVLRVGVSPQAYVTQLIEIIRSTAGRGVLSIPVVAMARPSTLEGRLAAILDDTRNRGGADRRLMLVGTGLVALLGLALGAVQLRAAEPTLVVPASPTAAKPGIPLLQEKLKSIVIDKINFDKADIATVILFLQQKSKELDPDHQGINFVLRLSGKQPASGAPVLIAPNIHQEVTLALENVSLGKILDEITRQTNLQYYVEDYAVYLRPATDDSEILSVRTYLVPTGFDMTPLIGTKPVAPNSQTPLDVKNQLIARGIIFSDGTAATFIPNTRKLVVRNTPKQLDLIASLFDAWMHPPAYLLTKPAATNVTAQEQPTAEAPAQLIFDAADVALNPKLKNIVLSVDFNNATIAEATNFLAIESKRLDPDHQGVSFIIQPQASTSAKPVTLALANVSLGEALRYVCQLANVKFKVEDDFAIAIIASTQDTRVLTLTDSEPMDQPASESGRATARKLKSIIIPNVNFSKLDVAMVLQFLAQKSRELDPDKKGINFVLGNISPQDHVHREVSVTLDNVPMADILGYIVTQTNLKCSIKDNAVYFKP